MTYIRYIPSPPLNAYIDDLYYLDGPAPYPRQKVMPVASSNLMINLGAPFDVYRPDQAEPFVTCTDSWLVGVWSTYHSVDWPLNVKFFGVHFKPGGAYPFLQFPLSDMNGQVLPLNAIWGYYASEIRERLYAAQTVQAGFTLFEQLLLARLCEAPRNLDIVQCAIAEIARCHGALSIGPLIDRVGISQNHLGTQFKRFAGIPPKEVARFYRFAHVLRLIDSSASVDLTLIAHQARFYDQSHFNKDFVAFTGYSPSEYVRLRRRVQAENPEHARVMRNLPLD
ncbi:MAG TPA: helix-turn-helix domain-containing protein [Anaerolineales bacterium]|nr:helix-turn-helix domain-containing protein [Anaerolineales bacterium]